MSGLDDLHEDEIRARLGLVPLGRPETMEERIERSFVTSMPELEEVDPATLMDDTCAGCTCFLSGGPCPHCVAVCTCDYPTE